MADLEDLKYESITDKSVDDAIELLRQTRLSRRTPVAKPTKTSTPKQSRKQKKTPELSPDQALELLKILEGKK